MKNNDVFIKVTNIDRLAGACIAAPAGAGAFLGAVELATKAFNAVAPNASPLLAFGTAIACGVAASYAAYKLASKGSAGMRMDNNYQHLVSQAARSDTPPTPRTPS